MRTLKADDIIKFINDNNWKILSDEQEKAQYHYDP
jgi:hypothetical protein